MPIDAEVALAAGAVNFSSTTPDNFASLFNANGVYRIANDYLGQNSAVLGIAFEKDLLVNPQGIEDPRREWIIGYAGGHILEHVAIIAPPTPTPPFANTSQSGRVVILGPAAQPFNFVPGPSTPASGGSPHVWIQDQKSGLVWELSESRGPEFPQVALVSKENNPKQLWVFYGPPPSQ